MVGGDISGIEPGTLRTGIQALSRTAISTAHCCSSNRAPFVNQTPTGFHTARKLVLLTPGEDHGRVLSVSLVGSGSFTKQKGGKLSAGGERRRHGESGRPLFHLWNSFSPPLQDPFVPVQGSAQRPVAAFRAVAAGARDAFRSSDRLLRRVQQPVQHLPDRAVLPVERIRVHPGPFV